MKITNLIESICLMICVCLLRLALIAAGCWMMYNGWFGCGITTIILNIFVGAHCDSNETKTTKKDDTGKAVLHLLRSVASCVETACPNDCKESAKCNECPYFIMSHSGSCRCLRDRALDAVEYLTQCE